MRILLLGPRGQVGFELRRALAPLGEVIVAGRERIDLAHPDTVRVAVRALEPDLIVNAAAYTAVDRAESEPDLAHAVNAEAVGRLAEAALDRGIGLVHYSTDYVFPGDANRPYREDDATGPTGAYGASKLAGEQAIRDSGCAHLIFRTAWVYATRGQNFLRTMLRLAGERERLTVVDDQHGSPTPARLIAEATALALARWLPQPPGQRRSGCYHLVSAGQTTWHGFASALLAGAEARGLIARLPEVAAIPTSDFPTPARRPPWSVLDGTRLRREFGLALPDWRSGLDLVLGELAEARAAAIR